MLFSPRRAVADTTRHASSRMSPKRDMLAGWRLIVKAVAECAVMNDKPMVPRVVLALLSGERLAAVMATLEARRPPKKAAVGSLASRLRPMCAHRPPHAITHARLYWCRSWVRVPLSARQASAQRAATALVSCAARGGNLHVCMSAGTAAFAAGQCALAAQVSANDCIIALEKHDGATQARRPARFACSAGVLATRSGQHAGAVTAHACNAAATERPPAKARPPPAARGTQARARRLG